VAVGVVHHARADAVQQIDICRRSPIAFWDSPSAAPAARSSANSRGSRPL
jgi:hypothetical protein